MKLIKLQKLLSKNHLAAYLIPSNDEFMTELGSLHINRLELVTNFSGSNGIALIIANILKSKSLLITDGRYIEQAENEVDKKFFDIINFKDCDQFKWNNYLNENESVGYDPKLFTQNSIKIFQKLELKEINHNLVDEIWDDKPNEPFHKIYHYPLKFSGESSKTKLENLRKFLVQQQAEYIIITATDSLCWLFNIRGKDNQFSPLVHAYAIVSCNKIIIFTEISKIQIEAIQNFENAAIISAKYFYRHLQKLDGKIIVDPDTASLKIIKSLCSKTILFLKDPCQLFKAVKNSIEINRAKDYHINDAVAMCEFLSNTVIGENEYTLGKKLDNLRTKNPNFIMPSFPTICGFKENGAIIHYRAQIDKSKIITGDGLLLVDSGGQYFGSTTDVTRTIILGRPTAEQKLRYTQVLKGHIALRLAIFPYGTCGAHLDILARQFLWQSGLNYAHGTGHGVGNFLNVHEGPQSISSNLAQIVLEPGMILSNEPGFYKKGEYGIRIENLVYICQSQFDGFLTFKDLTLVPYCSKLINFNRLNDIEIKYLNKYARKIQKLVRPKLLLNSQKWLDNELKFFLKNI